MFTFFTIDSVCSLIFAMLEYRYFSTYVHIFGMGVSDRFTLIPRVVCARTTPCSDPRHKHHRFVEPAIRLTIREKLSDLHEAGYCARHAQDRNFAS